MRFVPVKFCFENRTIRQPNGRDSLQFPPRAAPVLSIQAPAIADSPMGGDHFDRSDVAEYLEPQFDGLSQWKLLPGLTIESLGRRV